MLSLKISFGAANIIMNTYTSVSQFEPHNIENNLEVSSRTSVPSLRWVGVHCTGHRWDDVWEMKYRGLRRLNIIIFYFFSIKYIKETYLWRLPVLFDVNSSILSFFWLLLCDPCQSTHTADHSFYHANENVTTIVPLFSRTEWQGSQNNSKKND